MFANPVFAFTDIRFIPPPEKSYLDFELRPGGTLDENTSYYYAVFSRNSTGGISYGDTIPNSGLSNEVNCTTNQTFRTCYLNWSKPTGAARFGIGRSLIAGDYAESTYFKFLDDPPPGVTNYTDDGSKSLEYMFYMFAFFPESGYELPGNISPRRNGTGTLIINKSTDVIDMDDIYDYLVDNGYKDWVYWDGSTFFILGDVYFSGTEQILFKDDNFNFLSFGKKSFTNSNVDSSIQFGDISDGITGFGVRFLTACRDFSQLSSQALKLYNVELTGFKNTKWNSCGNIRPGSIANYEIIQGASQGLTLSSPSLTAFVSSSSGAFENIKLHDSRFYGFSGGKLLKNIESSSYLYTYSRGHHWLDKLTSYTTGSCIWMHSIVNSLTLIDPSFPKSTEENRLPKMSWKQWATQTNPIYIRRSFLARILDVNGNPVNPSISIYDKNNNIAQDINGFNCSNMTLDAYGFLWSEKINITSATSRTITDSSKNWTTNEWQGRNFYIAVGNASMPDVWKIRSNTNDTLTFSFDFVTIPNEGTLGGIELWLEQVVGYSNFTSSSITNWTYKSPFTIKGSLDGYEDLEQVVDLTGYPEYRTTPYEITMVKSLPVSYEPTRILISGGTQLGAYGASGVLICIGMIWNYIKKKRRIAGKRGL